MFFCDTSAEIFCDKKKFSEFVECQDVRMNSSERYYVNQINDKEQRNYGEGVVLFNRLRNVQFTKT
jgi:hypothetical protein